MSRMCYVGVKACGCAVAAVVDDDDPARKKDVAKSIASWVRHGMTVERHTVEWVRENLHSCKCNQPPAQESLGLPLTEDS